MKCYKKDDSEKEITMLDWKERMKNRKVKAKLKFVAGFLISAMLIMSLVASVSTAILKSLTNYITEWMAAIEIADDLNYYTSNYRMNQFGHVISNTEEQFASYESTIVLLEEKINTLLEEYEASIEEEYDAKKFAEAVEAWEHYQDVTGEEFFALSRAMKLEEANAIMLGEGRDSFNRFQEIFDELAQYNREGAEKEVHKIHVAFWSVTIGIIVILVFSVICAVALCKVLIGNIVTPVEELQEASHKLVAGQFDMDLTYNGQDELGELARNFKEAYGILRMIIQDSGYLLNEMAEGNFNINTKQEEKYVGEFAALLSGIRRTNRKLDATLKRIDIAAGQVTLGSGELAESAQSLSEGATEQASAVEELTALIESVTELAENGTENANNAAEKVSVAVKDAETTRSEMNELIQAMQRITDTSKEIENIIASIEDIASQTNLLSLNASIEAARAGDAGRGFAVVADQIGKLANDSAQSAVTTKELIGKSIVEVRMGNQIVENTIKAISNVLSSMEIFKDLASENAESSHAQTQMMREIKEGVSQIATVVQSNSATSEETSAISEELSAQAVSLKQMVDVFQLRD